MASYVFLSVSVRPRLPAGPQVMSRREVSLAGTVLREGKALVVVANKADVLSVAQRRAFTKVHTCVRACVRTCVRACMC